MKELTYQVKYKTHNKDDVLGQNAIRVKREFTMQVPNFDTLCHVIKALERSHDELIVEGIELIVDDESKKPTKRFKFKNP